GLYLPLALTTPIFAGGALRWLVERRARGRAREIQAKREAGILYSSGLIAGAALLGVLIAVPVAFAPEVIERIRIGPDWAGTAAPAVSVAAFLVLMLSIYGVATRAREEPMSSDPDAGVRAEQM